MSLLSDLGTKIGTELKSLWNSVNGKLGVNDKAADSNLLDGIDSSFFIKGDNITGCIRATDFDTITKSGFYDGDSTVNGNPFGNWAWVIHHEHAHDNGHGFQIAIENNNSERNAKIRIQQNNVWGAWGDLGGNKTISTSVPSGGSHGDVWYQV